MQIAKSSYQFLDVFINTIIKIVNSVGSMSETFCLDF